MWKEVSEDVKKQYKEKADKLKSGGAGASPKDPEPEPKPAAKVENK